MQIVIIGGPSAGKTTVVNMLGNEGFTVVEEISRALLTEGIVPPPWIDRHAFQQEQLRRQLFAEEKTLHSKSICFLDGGVFDGVAYYLSDGLPVPDIFDSIDSKRYALAMLFEELPSFEEDGIRYQNAEFTTRITVLLEKCYRLRGIEVVRIPAASPRERLELVLSIVARASQKLG